VLLCASKGRLTLLAACVYGLLHQSQLRKLPADTIASAQEVQMIVDYLVYTKECAERVQVYHCCMLRCTVLHDASVGCYHRCIAVHSACKYTVLCVTLYCMLSLYCMERSMQLKLMRSCAFIAACFDTADCKRA
jgi:hypothetical protein